MGGHSHNKTASVNLILSEESQSRLKGDPASYQPSALLGGQTGSRFEVMVWVYIIFHVSGSDTLSLWEGGAQ